MTTFADLGLSAPLLEALRDVGYENPSPIQEQAIPPLLDGSDVIGQAQTGSGKTAAFGLPLIQAVDPDEQEVQGLVLTPTRELCIQVTQALRTYGARKGVDVVAVFGGAPIRSQQAQLRAGGQIVVGTVGRVKDLISRHSLVLHSCRFVVLDEADEMLDLGFLEDVERILSLTPGSRQTALFSATMPPEIRKLSERYLYDPVLVRVKAATLTVDSVEQFSIETKGPDKNELLARVLEAEKPDQAIVFVRTKIRCDQLNRTLRDRGMNVRALHGDMSQGARDGVMIAFKSGRLPILVATDVAARGLDISSVTHVVNFDVPVSPDIYVHRIGRTGRVGRSGRAITFYESRQKRDLEAIEEHTKTPMAPWTPGAKVAPLRVEAKPRRHQKPEIAAAEPEPVEVEVVGTVETAPPVAPEPTPAVASTPAPATPAREAESEPAATPRPARRRAARVRTADADVPTPPVVVATNGAAVENGDTAVAKGDRGRARRVAEGETAKLVVAGGRVDGIEPKDLIHAITKATGLDGTAIRNVRVLDRFAFVDVPAADASRVVETVDGTAVDGHVLRLEPVRG